MAQVEERKLYTYFLSLERPDYVECSYDAYGDNDTKLI